MEIGGPVHHAADRSPRAHARRLSFVVFTLMCHGGASSVLPPSGPLTPVTMSAHTPHPHHPHPQSNGARHPPISLRPFGVCVPSPSTRARALPPSHTPPTAPGDAWWPPGFVVAVVTIASTRTTRACPRVLSFNHTRRADLVWHLYTGARFQVRAPRQHRAVGVAREKRPGLPRGGC